MVSNYINLTSFVSHLILTFISLFCVAGQQNRLAARPDHAVTAGLSLTWCGRWGRGRGGDREGEMESWRWRGGDGEGGGGGAPIKSYHTVAIHSVEIPDIR